MPKKPEAVVGAAVGIFALAVVPPGVPTSVVPVEPRLPKRPLPVAGLMPKRLPLGAFPPIVPVIGPPPKREGGALEVPVVVPVPPPNNPLPAEVVLFPPPCPVANGPKEDPDDPCVPVFC